MRIKHTPGPWVIDEHPKDSFWIFAPNAKNKIVLLHTTRGKNVEDDIMDRANAILIASAPELLYALIKAKKVIERLSEEYSYVMGKRSSYSDDESEIIDAAINKAIFGREEVKKRI